MIGGLKGYYYDSNLTISDNKQLIIELQKIENADKPQDSYTIISGLKMIYLVSW